MKSKQTKVKKIITAEKQAYIDRYEKRAKLLAKNESRRRRKKIGVNYIPLDGDAPCAYMVECVKKEVKDDTMQYQTSQQEVGSS